MNVPVDVVVISDIGATLGAVVAVPQIVVSLRAPQSLSGISWFGLLFQSLALCSFLYVDVRLTLWVPALQIAGSLAGVVLLLGLKSWGRRRCIVTPRHTVTAGAPAFEPDARHAAAESAQLSITSPA